MITVHIAHTCTTGKDQGLPCDRAQSPFSNLRRSTFRQSQSRSCSTRFTWGTAVCDTMDYRPSAVPALPYLPNTGRTVGERRA